MMNDLFLNEWSYLHNFFLPSMKLDSKERINGKVIKRHSPPKTPLLRLVESKLLTQKKEKELQKIFNEIDPFELQKRVEKKIKNILNYAMKGS